MSKKIIFGILALFLTMPIFSQFNPTGASFKFGDVSSWWIPKFKPFGNSTTFTDSTNYVTINKGLYVFDSIKTDRDLIVKGAVVLDTNRQGKIYYSGNDIYFNNAKGGAIFLSAEGSVGNNGIIISTTSGSQEYKVGTGTGGFYSWQKQEGLFQMEIMLLDTVDGLNVKRGNIQVNGTTQQIKLPSDTATDYDANDAVTLNRQSGKITTKSLTTASDGFYTFTLTNSLISATTKIFVNWTGGTESAGRPTIYKATCGSGSATIIILNLTGAGSFNGTVQLDYVIFN